MNKIQERTVERLKADILLHDGLGKTHVHGYEYKEFKIEEYSFARTFPKRRTVTQVFLSTEVGLKGDEKTMASVFGRKRRLIVVGPEGGVRSLYKDRSTGYQSVLIHGYEY